MTAHNKPHGNMTAEQIIELFANPERHPNALGYEMRRCRPTVIIRLAYGKFATDPLEGVPEDLGSLAYAEMGRRDNAHAVLRASLTRAAS